MNSWLLNVLSGGSAGEAVGNIGLDIATEHAGAFSVMCQFKAVG